MRRYCPPLFLMLAALAPAALTGCDNLISKLKGGGSGDAGDGGAASVPGLAETGTATATEIPPTTAPTATAVRPMPTLPTIRTVVALDAGTKADAAAHGADAGSVKMDAGTPSPLPTPTLNLPNLFDGGLRFDAGGFKPPWQK